MIENDKIIPVKIEEEMRSSYIDYSMSVIVSRALPDVRDGFKPVHRRVLFGMNELGNTSDKPTKKSARIVGEVMGKYHPHGDSSIYMTLVRMAQPWSMRYTLVDGQGNFGSVDGDSPAAMRYTEARLSKLAEEMLRDIDMETVDMQLNFDDTLKEPTVLPCRFPNLLVNGANGIAVGMATNMPTHNLGESIDACIAYINNRDISIEELMHYIPAPDFPTGGTIYGYQGVRDAYETGRGRIVIRSKAEIETEENGRERIVISELPYNVNKAELVSKIAELVSDKRIEGISGISDHSKRDVRIVVEIKRDGNAQVVLNKLYKHTALQSSFSVNNIALVKGTPRLLNLKDIISLFIEHRMDVVTRRTRFELRKAEARLHILKGLIIAVDNIDEVIKIIRANRTQADAQVNLESRFGIDNLQSKAIVDMRLGALTGLRIEELRQEFADLEKLVEHLKAVLESEDMRYDIIKTELNEVKDKYNDPRRTQIVKMATEFNEADMYADDSMVITISHLGYIKRTPLVEFKQQGRGGVGSRATAARDEDFIEYVHEATNHSTLLLFTQLGRLYWLKVYEIPEGNRQSKGRAIQNMINLQKDDKICAFINVKELNNEDYIRNHYLIFATKNGLMKKTSLEAYSRPRANGIVAVKFHDEDSLINVSLTDGQSQILIASRNGKIVRFDEASIRPMGRSAHGVKAITLEKDGVDCVVGSVCVENNSDKTILVISSNGYGKRSALDDEEGNAIYRVTNRGGKGVKTMNLTDKTGYLIALDAVNDDEDLMLITKSGTAIRMSMDAIRVMGRNTQGVRLIDLQKRNDTLMFGCSVPKSEEVTEEETNEE